MNIIGVCGKGGSGKDTIANYLVEHYDFNRVAAADAMKVDLCKYLDMDLVNHGKFSVRRFLQLYGMDMRYRIADTYWLERSIQDKVKELGTNGETNIVVSDVRFEIEYDWIKKNGGDVIYVGGRTGLTKDQSEHVSENFVNTTARDECDHYIDNCGNYNDLYEQIEGYINGEN